MTTKAANGSKKRTVASNGDMFKTKAETTSKRKSAAVTGPVASKAEIVTPPCLCGCGNQVKRPGSRFLQGHDAALKGYLQRHYLNAPRPTDPTLGHLAENFAAVTGDKVKPEAEAILVAVNPNWLQFLDSAQMRLRAEKIANRATKAATATVEKVSKAAKSGGKAVVAMASKATKATNEVRRMIGSIAKTGTVEGGMFKFVNGAGNTVAIPLGKTKAAPSA